MIKKDYMKEIENALKLAKREVDKNIINGDMESANAIINKELKGLVGLDITTIDTLSFSSIKDVVSRDNQYNAEKYIALGELLSLQGFVYQGKGDEENTLRYYRKAIESFYQAYEEDDSIEEKYLSDAKHIVEILVEYELEIDDELRIFRVYELTNQLDKAEDILFYIIKESENDRDVIQKGMEFYSRLKDKPEEILIDGNLPLEEIEDSYLELKKLL